MSKNKKRHVKSHQSFDRFRIMTAILGVLLLISVFTNGFTSSSQENRFIFLEPPKCNDKCARAREAVKDVAEKTGLGFEPVAHSQAAEPSFVLVYNKRALTSRFVDRESLSQQVCGFTGLKEACSSEGMIG